jgi:hypothetical protein
MFMSDNEKKPPTYSLVLADVGSQDLPVEVRLRRLLKAALRCYGFRCQLVCAVTRPGPAAAAPTQDAQDAGAAIERNP